MEPKLAFIGDEPGVLETLYCAFKGTPYKPDMFSNSSDLFQRLEKEEYTVVVADQDISDIKGFEILQRVKHKNPSTMCILMMERSDLDIAANAMDCGDVFRFIFKPVDTFELKTAITNAIELFNSRAEISRLLKLTNDQREQVNTQKMEAMETLADGIAHDLNNILSGIVGYSEVAQMLSENNKQVFDILGKVLDTCDRAKNLIDQVLSFSRHNYQTHDEELIQMAPVIDEAIKNIKDTLPDNIQIRETIDSNTGLIKASPAMLQQVLINLITNAVYAMQEKGGVLSVSLSAEKYDGSNLPSHIKPESGHYLNLSISDTGSGIPEEIMGNIFDPYFTTKENGEGTGLGLSVVHGIIKNYRGTIIVNSTPGISTVFKIMLPLVIIPEDI